MSNDRRSARLRHTHGTGDIVGVLEPDQLGTGADGAGAKFLRDDGVWTNELIGTYEAATGSLGAPAYSFIGDPNTGIMNVAADTLGFVNGGTLRLQIESGGKLRVTGEIWCVGTLQENDERLYFALAANTGNNYYKTGGTGAHVFRNASDTDNLVVLTDGRVYGTALHNNANGVTGTTTQYIASGTYTPTLTNVSNANSLSANAAQWMRVGNVVTVSGTFSVTPAVGTVITIAATLPIASNISGNTLAGAAGLIQGSSVGAGFVFGDSANDRAQINVMGISAAASTVSYTFTYLVAA